VKYSSFPNERVAEIPDPLERRIRAALRAGKIGVFEFEPKVNRAYWDDRVRELWGIPDAELITYEVVVAQVHPDDQEMHNRETERVLDPAGDGHMDMTYRLLPKDGHPMRWIRAQADCFFQDGEAVRLVGTVTDVTEIQTALELNKLLVRELAHRVKNVLATAVAVVGLSRAGATSVEEYFTAIDQRLRSLVASQDLVRQSEWSPVRLDALFEASAKGFLGRNRDTERLSISVGDIEVPPDHVMIFSMGLHELLTNAVKHGALSSPVGRVSVKACIGVDAVTIVWSETGGPAPAPRGHQGFGVKLLKEIWPAQIDGVAGIDHVSEGMTYSIRIPHAAMNVGGSDL